MCKAKVWTESVSIPTYEIGQAEKNPVFIEKRVYQGSSGKVYPYPVVEKISDTKIDKTYTAVYLENEYLKVMILPELGGRIQRAFDKTGHYDFVYYNEVIKPALVGLTGPWISGGIEFNWPQHHRPTTFAPTDYQIRENSDGSCTAECSEVDQMYGTKGKVSFTLYPERAYIEVCGQLYNRTPLPQTFLWWANPAVAVNDFTQSVFPPDVTAVFDHGKRAVSRFPIATGVYYKHDYGAGVDISRYKNIPVPTSYMCAHSDYNFVGGYDYRKEAGILHVADHHVSPGKKQWTWGCGDFGKAWDRNLTDENGPYIELMTGMFCDNQPDFTWLKPFEEKTFTQYFMPYKAAADVKNAGKEIALNLKVQNHNAEMTVYASAVYEDAKVVLTENTPEADRRTVYEKTVTLSPVDILQDSCTVTGEETALTLSVYDAAGRKLLSYSPQPRKIEKIPDPMSPAGRPEEIMTVEELYLTGLHIEQYRHATYLPDPYYLEALRRDPGDIRSNTAYGLLLLRRGQFTQSEPYFRRAIERMTLRNPNPYDSEAYFDLGLCLFYQERMDEAYDAFYKSTWTAAQQETGFYYLAAIDCRRGDFETALTHIEQSLVKNWHNLKARALKGRILDRLGRKEEAAGWYQQNLDVDAFDYSSRIASGDVQGACRLMGERISSYLECAIDHAEAGMYRQALNILDLCPKDSPLLHYYKAFYTEKEQTETERPGKRQAVSENVQEELAKAAACDSSYCFPNKPEDIAVLEMAIRENPSDARAPYYLGCLEYDRLQYECAAKLWEMSAERDGSFPTVWRNLAIAYYNRLGKKQDAKEYMEKAFRLGGESDPRILLELEQLYRRLGRSMEDCRELLDTHREVTFRRDDLYIEYVKLLNLQGEYEKAYDLIMARKFHPWEGGEGRVTAQYTTALVQMARKSLAQGNAVHAEKLLRSALVYPQNLGEGKLEGAKDNHIYYYLGLAQRALGNEAEATADLERAAAGGEEPSSAMYYNDQPADLILYEGLADLALGRTEQASSRFHSLITYGEKHYYDQGHYDFFAVSLPDMQLFESDLTADNRIYCNYLIGLGSLGLGDKIRAGKSFDEVLKADPTHQGAHIAAAMLSAN